MKRPPKRPLPPAPPEAPEPDPSRELHFELDPESVKAMREMALQIKGSGFVPHAVLRKQFGDRPFTIFSAIAYRDYRLVREVRRVWENDQTSIGYEWGDRRFSKQEAKKIPLELRWIEEITKAVGPRYKDFARLELGCEWTNAVLAALPVPHSDKLRVFERVNGDVVITGYNVRSMIKKVLPLVGKTQALGDNIRYAAVRVHINGNIAPKLMPIVDERMHQGRGVTEHESLPSGTPFVLEMWYPSSEISEEQLVEAIALAGRVVRLSPARSSGYGDFVVRTVNGSPL